VIEERLDVQLGVAKPVMMMTLARWLVRRLTGAACSAVPLRTLTAIGTAAPPLLADRGRLAPGMDEIASGLGLWHP
jgi:hypothetical protein